jgi:hypothetical protein
MAREMFKFEMKTLVSGRKLTALSSEQCLGILLRFMEVERHSVSIRSWYGWLILNINLKMYFVT